MKRITLEFFIAALALGLGSLPVAHAVTTEQVNHDTFAEFSQGEFDNISLTSEGYLELAPGMTNLATLKDPIIWTAVRDKHGNVFIGTGNQGKIYKLDSKGKLSTFFAPNEVMIHALAIDHKGRLYAATSPKGRVYRFDDEGHATVYCVPDETYIWAMTFGKDGSLYLATGNRGKILRVPANSSTPAKVETYFETGETHVTALAWGKDGNLLAGTSPHGYLYRIDKANHGFVLFNSGDDEIKQIAVAPDGTIYASSFVESPSSKSSATPAVSGVTIISTSGGADSASKSNKTGSAAAAHSASAAAGEDDSAESPNAAQIVASIMSAKKPRGAGGKSLGAIYRISTNGFYEKYWSAPNEAIYSMTLLPDGSLLVGTGDKGRIYSLSSPNRWKLLQQTSDGAQVSVLLPAADGSKEYYAATSHPAWMCRLNFALADKGIYTSKALDANQVSQWGNIHPDGNAPTNTSLEFSTRSGNTEKPDKTWSDWSAATPLDSEINIASPPARYLQYRAEFQRNTNAPSTTAQLQRVRLYYQNQNAAPVVSNIRVYAEGFGVSKMPMPVIEAPMNLAQLLGKGRIMTNRILTRVPPLKVTRRPGLCTVVWSASDPNQDDLIYSVAIRSEHEKDWTTLVDKTDDTFYSFDTAGFSEGYYYVRVTASDKPSNTPETTRNTSETSEAFLIDNTAPALTVAEQKVEKDSARFVVDATDKTSVINSASYSLDGKDDINIRPKDLIFDSRKETFVIDLNDLDKGAHSLLLHVQNEANNTAVLKLNFECR